MFTEDKMLEMEKVYQEIKHPYTKKNLSFRLFRWGLWALYSFALFGAVRLVLALIVPLVNNWRTTEELLLSGWLSQYLLLVVGWVLLGLGIAFRKKMVKRAGNSNEILT